MLIVIPTRNRIVELTNTLNFLESNKFFFKINGFNKSRGFNKLLFQK